MADTSAGASDESQGSGPMIVQLQTLRALARKGLLTHEDVGQIVHDSEQMLAEPDRSRFRELAATIAPTAAAEDEPETPASTKGQVNFTVTPKQILDAQRAVDTASLNGIMFLAMLLKRLRGLSARQADLMHAQMSKPLGVSGNATNPMVQIVQRRLDEQFARIRETAAE